MDLNIKTKINEMEDKKNMKRLTLKTLKDKRDKLGLSIIYLLISNELTVGFFNSLKNGIIKSLITRNINKIIISVIIRLSLFLLSTLIIIILVKSMISQ